MQLMRMSKRALLLGLLVLQLSGDSLRARVSGLELATAQQALEPRVSRHFLRPGWSSGWRRAAGTMMLRGGQGGRAGGLSQWDPEDANMEYGSDASMCFSPMKEGWTHRWNAEWQAEPPHTSFPPYRFQTCLRLSPPAEQLLRSPTPGLFAEIGKVHGSR